MHHRTFLVLVLATMSVSAAQASTTPAAKPSPTACLQQLMAGNERFVAGTSRHPHSNAERLAQAGSQNQGDHAFATVLTCSDSRVPVEMLFDAGIMDIFVIRVAGNVCDTDEVGSIEYGLCHVKTPVLVVLGHTQCGAVTAVTGAIEGHGHALERNIPPLVDNIQPAVERARKLHPNLHGEQLIPHGIVENVWQGIEDLFLASPAVRELVRKGAAKVVGAIYDVATGRIAWLPEDTTTAILAAVDASPRRAKDAMADGHEADAAESRIERQAPEELRGLDLRRREKLAAVTKLLGAFADTCATLSATDMDDAEREALTEIGRDARAFASVLAERTKRCHDVE